MASPAEMPGMLFDKDGDGGRLMCMRREEVPLLLLHVDIFPSIT